MVVFAKTGKLKEFCQIFISPVSTCRVTNLCICCAMFGCLVMEQEKAFVGGKHLLNSLWVGGKRGELPRFLFSFFSLSLSRKHTGSFVLGEKKKLDLNQAAERAVFL